MKGLREIVFSATLTLVALWGWARYRAEAQRPTPNVTAPTAVAGESEDLNLASSWGLQAVHAPSAWPRHSGSKNVIVAVIDTGCDVHHPSLHENLWRNPGEAGLDADGMPKSSNGVDDDDNGFVDDYYGWNFVGATADVADDHGHGTHIAGIIGARASEGMPARALGIAPHVSLMILKYYDAQSSGKDNLRNTIAAIRYAVRMGADIINYSGGGIMRSAEEEGALRWASTQGVLVVAAAGNEGLNSDFFHFYPADYALPNILSVGAIDRNEELLRSSNYGINTVHLVAPGKNIYSTLPNGQFGYMSGTSQATAFASGVAALLIANDARLRDPRALIDHLVANASPREKLFRKVRAGGVLDAKLALDRSDAELTTLAGRNRMPSGGRALQK